MGLDGFQKPLPSRNIVCTAALTCLVIYLLIYLFVIAVIGNSRERSQPSIITFQGERDGVRLTFGTSYPHLEPLQSWKLGGNPKLTVH